jgi:hypothetical protein
VVAGTVGGAPVVGNTVVGPTVVGATVVAGTVDGVRAGSSNVVAGGFVDAASSVPEQPASAIAPLETTNAERAQRRGVRSRVM